METTEVFELIKKAPNCPVSFTKKQTEKSQIASKIYYVMKKTFLKPAEKSHFWDPFMWKKATYIRTDMLHVAKKSSIPKIFLRKTSKNCRI